MKKLLLIALLLPLFSFGQTRTSAMNGDFWNPLTWTPFGLPASGETVIINHAVVMNLDIWYTAGSITINTGGSLIEDATNRSFWCDGTGSLINAGTFTSHLMWMSPGTTLMNSGTLANIDSLWNQGEFTNNGTAVIYDFWNDQTGIFNNSGNLSNADSLLNQGIFTNSGSASVYDFLNDEMATWSNSGNMVINNNMNNQGLSNNQGTIDLLNDFSNCNTQSLDAWFINNGIFCIAADMTNCIGDTMVGTGDYYIGGSSSNFGVFGGTFTFHTPSGTIGIPGMISPSVTVTTGACNLGIEVLDEANFTMYPNPATSSINVSLNNVHYALYDYVGKLISSGDIKNHQIDITEINTGMYTLIIEDYGTSRFVKN